MYGNEKDNSKLSVIIFQKLPHTPGLPIDDKLLIYISVSYMEMLDHAIFHEWFRFFHLPNHAGKER